MELKNKHLTVEISPRNGNIESLLMNNDPLKTEVAGRKDLVLYPSIQKLDQWLGDWKFRVWDEKTGGWTEELTSESVSIRRTVQEQDSVTISYEGVCHRDKGLKNISLRQTFALKEDKLHWDVTVKNPGDKPIELGEMSMAFVTNTDFSGVFEDALHVTEERWRGWKQKAWHEQRFQRHLSINGSSSYALLQRPKGDFPAMLFQTADGTALEAAYQMDTHIGWQWECTFEGPYYLSVFSKAARKCEGWLQNGEAQRYWFNGNSSRVLAPGEEMALHFLFRPIMSREEMNEALYEAGQVSVDVQPGMVAPVDVPVRVRLHCKDAVRVLKRSNNFEITDIRQEGEYLFFTLVSSQMGQKKVRLEHGNGVTNLFFYAVGAPEEILEKHAEFVTTRQFYENKDDPYGRYHAFLPFDDSVETLYTESEESWQVGASDEYALPVAMFAAEKNVNDPNEKEIAVLEAFVNDFLYGVLQQKDTYYARRGMYYEEKTPSDIYIGNKWDKETAESILRSFNYPLIIDVYFAMYQIAKKYPELVRVRTAAEYLEMAWRTAMVGYGTGRNKFNGAPAGATIVELLDVLKEEKPDWFAELDERISFITAENAKSDYPYGSELYVDQTAHNQLQAMLKHYGYTEKLKEAYQVTYALRGGWQPQWFQYGNEKRGNVCCWYGTPLNSRVLFDGFDANGDIDYLRMGYAGLFMFLTCIRSNGAAHGWFLFWPDRTGFDLRSLDTDMGMYGYLKSAKSYLVHDPIFGLSGYGCTAEKIGDELVAVPYDGVGIRFAAPEYGFALRALTGRMKEIRLDPAAKKAVVTGTGTALTLDTKAAEGWTVEIH